MLRNVLIRRLILTLALTGPAGCAASEMEATVGAHVDSYNIFYDALSLDGEPMPSRTLSPFTAAKARS